MRYRSSIEVIEDVLGRPLFDADFRFRSFAEADEALKRFAPPVLSPQQFEAIGERLATHWIESAASEGPERSPLFMNGPTLSFLHRSLPVPEEEYWRASTTPDQLLIDVPIAIRRALLYSSEIVIPDPALASWGIDGRFHEDRWRSTYLQLGFIHRLVNRSCVTLAPIHPSTLEGCANEREGTEMLRLQMLARSDVFGRFLDSSTYFEKIKHRAELGIALGQFSFRNVYSPSARTWIPNAAQLRALTALETALGSSVMRQVDVIAGRLSTLASVDPLRCSDDDLVIMRDDDLLSLWQGIVASTMLEIESRPNASQAHVAMIIGAQQERWRSVLDERIGRSRFLEGVLDRNALTCGLISAGASLLAGNAPEVVAASALGGGLVVPLLNLLSNANNMTVAKYQGRAVAAHFMALGALADRGV